MNDRDQAPVLFKEITLQNWRNFKKASAELQPRTFVVGPNASGKSNFLDAFRFLRDLAVDGGGLAKAVADRGGVSSIRNLAARTRPAITVSVKAVSMSNVEWRYSLSIKQDNRSRPLVEREELHCNDESLVDRPNDNDKKDNEQLTQTYIEQVRENAAFRPLIEFFRSVRYLHLVPQLLKSRERYRGSVNDPYGWDFLERIGATPEKTRTAWLRQIETKLRVAVPQLQDLQWDRDSKGLAHLKSKYMHWRPQGAWQTEDDFSDGTLRLIGLLWAILERTGPLLLEEPELSLNPHVIRHIPSMLTDMARRTGRQVILSTHSPDILSGSGISLAEVLLCIPAKEGSILRIASDIRDAKVLVREGMPISEVVMPHTRPPNADQLSLPLL